MVRTPIAHDVDVTLLRYVIDKPTDLIGVGLNDDLILRARVDNSRQAAIGVAEVVVHIGFYVFQPNLLPGTLKTSGRGIVQIAG